MRVRAPFLCRVGWIPRESDYLLHFAGKEREAPKQTNHAVEKNFRKQITHSGTRDLDRFSAGYILSLWGSLSTTIVVICLPMKRKSPLIFVLLYLYSAREWEITYPQKILN
jgi:hypothetical protein